MSMIVNSIKMFYNKYQFGFFILHESHSNYNDSIFGVSGYQGMGNSCYIANPINNTTAPFACFLSYSPGNKSSNNLYVPSNTLKKM